jgi:HD superfamily phosphodiesterase
MQTTERLIKNTESQWLEPLKIQCRGIFKNTHLPSHDELHHNRVWNHAKDLLNQLAKNGVILNEKDIEKLIIAVFFHDTGMTVTMQKDHGKISRKIAKDFLKDKNFSPLELEEILDAVEHHDQKDYKVTGKSEINLQALLNISDDLDAFSFIGAYRYTEIYLLRNTPVKDLSDPVLDNLQKRFQNMKDFLSFSPNYLKAQNLRYMATRNYFKDLNFQIKHVGDDLSTYNGPIGIANFIKELMVDQKLSVQNACKQALLIADDFYVTNFFEKLEKEN